MAPRNGGSSGLRSFAEAVSSAGDVDLAAWQERGIENPLQADGPIVWATICIAVVVTLMVVIVGLAVVVRPMLVLGHVALSGRRGQSAGLLIAAGVLVTLVVSGFAGFAVFQGLSAAAFSWRKRGRA